MKTNKIKVYEAPFCTQVQLETSCVLAGSAADGYTFGNHSLGIDDANTVDYNPEWF